MDEENNCVKCKYLICFHDLISCKKKETKIKQLRIRNLKPQPQISMIRLDNLKLSRVLGNSI